MKTITIKKTELAMYKGLGKTTEEIATIKGITVKEAQEALATFGLIKSRKPVTSKEYTIELVDDTTTQVVDTEVNKVDNLA